MNQAYDNFLKNNPEYNMTKCKHCKRLHNNKNGFCSWDCKELFRKEFGFDYMEETDRLTPIHEILGVKDLTIESDNGIIDYNRRFKVNIYAMSQEQYDSFLEWLKNGNRGVYYVKM